MCLQSVKFFRGMHPKFLELSLCVCLQLVGMLTGIRPGFLYLSFFVSKMGQFVFEMRPVCVYNPLVCSKEYVQDFLICPIVFLQSVRCFQGMRPVFLDIGQFVEYQSHCSEEYVKYFLICPFMCLQSIRLFQGMRPYFWIWICVLTID